MKISGAKESKNNKNNIGVNHGAKDKKRQKDQKGNEAFFQV